MKKSITFFAVILFLFSCTTDEDIPPEPTKIKKITEYIYDATEVGGKPVKKSLRDKSVYEYDVRGNLTVSYSYGLSQTWEFKFVFEYDENNRYQRGNQYWPNGKLVFTYKMVYDDSRNALEWGVYQPDGGIEDMSVLIYNDDKNVIEDRNCDLKNFDNYNYKNTYKYDTKNNLIEEKEYITGKLYSTTTYNYTEYDSNGSWTKRNEYNSETGSNPVLKFMYVRENEYY